MKKNIFKFATLSMALCASVACVSCSENEENGDNNLPSGNNEVLVGNELNGITDKDVTLKQGQTYKLTGKLQIQAPGKLTIEPGVKIISAYTDNISYILIEQGAQIYAVGTAEQPIVMTAERAQAGSWGGLHICGKASINVEGGQGKSEIGNAVYGGSDDQDNSGKLKYIRMEYTGQSLSSDTESNGITFYGVGSGTEASYLQICDGNDDGIEFFGGTVNVDHAIVENCGDDSFDWTEGWRGQGSNWIAYQTEGADCDCLIEADNNGDNMIASPFSQPVLKNLTLIGNKDTGAKAAGVKLRAGTHAVIENTVITGKTNDLWVETSETGKYLMNNPASLKNIGITSASVLVKQVEGDENNPYTNDMFLSSGNQTGQSFTFTNKYVGTFDGKGALDASDLWTAGWTK